MLFAFGLLFTTRAGLHWVDLVDNYINSYGLIIGGILQAIAVGWFYKPDKLRNYFNPISEYKIGSWWNFMVKFFIPIILTVLLVSNFIGDIREPHEGYDMLYQWLGGWGMLILVAVVSLILTALKRKDIEN